MTLCKRFDIRSSGKVKSDEGYSNRVTNLGYNELILKSEHPTNVVQIRNGRLMY